MGDMNVFQPELRIDTQTSSQSVRCNICGGPHIGAKILPCYHSMCLQCLNHNKHRNTLLCPQCNALHKLPQSGFDDWDDDVIITMDFGAEIDEFPVSAKHRESLQAIDAANAPLTVSATHPPRNLNEVRYETGSLHNPLAVTVDINDDIYIAEFGAHQISIFNKNAQRKGVIKGADHTEFTPTGVALNSRRQVVVTDIIMYRVMIFGRRGLFISEFGGKGSAPGQFLYPKGVDCHAGLMYVSDSKRVQVFRENGHFLRTFGENILSKPTSLTFSKQFIVVSDAENGIFIFNYDGEVVNSISDKGLQLGQLRSPFGVTFDEDGYIVVANGFNHRVDLFSVEGDFIATFGAQFFIVRGVAFMKRRRLVVVHGDRFQIFRTDSHPSVDKKRACTIL